MVLGVPIVKHFKIFMQLHNVILFIQIGNWRGMAGYYVSVSG